MPKQDFAFKFVSYPQDYKREVMGASLLLSFSLLDIQAYVLKYTPVGGNEGLIMDDMVLAEEALINMAILERGELAEVIRHAESFLAKLIQAVIDKKHAAEAAKLSIAVRTKRDVALLIQEVMAQNNKRHEGANVISYIAQSDRTAHDSIPIEIAVSVSDRFSHEALLTEVMSAVSERFYHEALFEECIVLSSRQEHSVVGSLFDPFIIALMPKTHDFELLEIVEFEKGPRDSMQTYQWDFGERSNDEAEIIRRVVYGERPRYVGATSKSFVLTTRDGRSSRIITKMVHAIRDGRAARKMLTVIDTWRMNLRPSIRMKDMKLGYRVPDTATEMTRMIYGALSRRAARIDTKWTFGTKKQYASKIDSDVLYAVFDSPEAGIYNAVSFAKKNGVAAEIYKAIMSDSKIEREAIIPRSENADGKAPIESHLEKARIFGNVKVAAESVMGWILSATGKAAHDTKWIEQTLFALMNVNYRQAVIEKLKALDKVSKDTIIHSLSQAEVPDPEGLLFEMQEMAWNKDKPNRPAGVLQDAGLAYWDIGFNDLLENWDPAWDYLAPPSGDYDYAGDITLVYDVNGVPLNPLSPTNLADVDVSVPITHPIPEWSNVGKEELWVDIYTFQDVLINFATIWKKETSRIAGMTGQQALQYVLRETYGILERESLLTPEYERVFRFARWYAETIVMQDSTTVLHRVYDPWRDGVATTGSFNGAADFNQMAPAGSTINSLSTSGHLAFSVENYIDGEFTLSMAITTQNPSSTSKLDVMIDDVIIYTHLAGQSAARMTFPVEMGNHSYRLVYSSEMGDVVKVSGLMITGVEFVEATTSHRDNGTVRGMRAVSDLIQNMLTYYQVHHKHKHKGALGVKQRKLWLS